MARYLAALAAAAALACGGTPQPDPAVPQDLSATEHEQQARKHDAIAEHYEDRAQQASSEQRTVAGAQCFDDPLEAVTTSGGERLDPPRPCWSALVNPTRQYKAKAQQHREIAAAHRTHAAALVRTERDACAGLGENEIAQSPFTQREDILAVEPIENGGTVRGTRIAFRRVPGLTGAWMERSLACHAARAAVLGYPREFMAFSPLALPDVTAQVEETPDRVIVTITSPRSEMAAAALGRARDLTAATAQAQ